MIKLPEIKDDAKRAYEQFHKSRLIRCLNKNRSEKEFEKIADYFADAASEDGWDPEKIHKLLVGSRTELQQIIDAIGVVKAPPKPEGARRRPESLVRKKFDALYKSFCQSDFGRNWADQIGVRTCPYCNRSYIFTVRSGGVRPQYDHFFPRADYPYLAVSMYNLIPCCSVCNLAKHDATVYAGGKITMLYPYENGYGHKAFFNAVRRDAPDDRVSAWLGTAQKYTVGLHYADGIDSELREQIENSWKAFKLQPLYEQHSDYIRDVLRTNYIYNEDYFESLAEQFPGLFASAAEARNLVYFNYLDEKDWDKRVLAKLTHDLEADD